MNSHAPDAPSALVNSMMFLCAVLLSVLAAVLGISLADANATFATLQVLPTPPAREETEREAPDTWTITKDKEIAATRHGLSWD